MLKKYITKQNTYIKDIQSDPREKIEVEIGDAKQKKFIPQFKTKHWDNETNFSLRYIDDLSGTVRQVGNKIEYIKAKEEVHFYDKPNAGEKGGYEIEVLLKEKPASNKIQFSIQTKGLNFYYQPPLTAQEKKDGAERAENVIGSYAVYNKVNKGNYIGGKNYATGKAFHIYRPKIIDKNGVEVWGGLNIDEKKGSLTVTVPQQFLDTAVYPILVDPTFGYTSIGASYQSTSSSYTSVQRLEKYTVADNFTLDSLSAYMYKSTSTVGCKLALYDDTSNKPINRLALSALFYPTTTKAWITKALTTPSQTAGDFWISISGYANGIGGGSLIAYDTVASINYTAAADDSEAIDADPYAGGTGYSYTRQFSFYATYTVASNNFTKTLSEAIALTDTKTLKSQKTFSEVLTLVAIIKAKANKKLTEVITLIDTQAIIGTFYKIFSETIIITDTISKAFLFIKTFLENIKLVDTIKKQTTKIFKEIITLVESTGFQVNRIFTETIILVSSILRKTQKSFKETITLADTIKKVITLFRTITETITLVDTLTRQLNKIKLFTETITIVDNVKKRASRTLTETITVIDTLTNTTIKLFSETITLVDNLIKKTQKTMIETITLSDNIRIQISRVFKETITATDNLTSVIKGKFSKGKTVLLTTIENSVAIIKKAKATILNTSKIDKNVLKLKSRDKHILKSKDNKHIL